jgi:phospholipid/cholesterol/gamma-HCH transport system substrate-binding protein
MVMENTKLELVVGAFVLVGILCLSYLSIKLGKLEVIGGDLYEVTALFNTATGLKSGAAIEIAGVEVGRVRGIALKEDRAVVTLAVGNGVKLYTDRLNQDKRDHRRKIFDPVSGRRR